jgi:hypothetical protein
MHSSFAFAFAVGCLRDVALGIRATHTLQQPAVTMFDFGYDFETSNLSDASIPSYMDSDRISPDYFLDHIRKAGGTTMRKWFDEVCKLEHKENGCEMVTEGGSLTEKIFNEIFDKQTSTIAVSVIHLREPVARAQSLVNMNLHSLHDTCQKGSFSKSHVDPDNCKHQTPSEELQRTSGLCRTMPATASPNIPMWNCWQNMYVKSLVGTDRRNSTVEGQWLEVDMEDLELAKQRLAKFSGVLITEWLGHPAVAEYLSQHVVHLTQTIPFCNAHKLDSFVSFTSQDWARVASENTYDTQLYEFAKELALQRMHDAGFSVSLDQLEKHT